MTTPDKEEFNKAIEKTGGITPEPQFQYNAPPNISEEDSKEAVALYTEFLAKVYEFEDRGLSRDEVLSKALQYCIVDPIGNVREEAAAIIVGMLITKLDEPKKDTENLLKYIELKEECLKDATVLCNKFIDKVNSGRAKSVETFSDCQSLSRKLAILATMKAFERSNHS